MSEADALSVLLTDRRETLGRVIKKAERVLKIDRETGETLLILPRNRLSSRELVATYLLGKHFASKLGRTTRESLDVQDICLLSGLKSDSVFAGLSELRKEGLIERVEDGSYHVVDRSLESFGTILDEIGRASATAKNTGPADGMDQSTMFEVSGAIDFTSVTDVDAVVLSLNSCKAFPSSETWLTADEIFQWTNEHGSFVRKDTLKKYTLPQDPTLGRLIVRRKTGRQRQYQLSRLGFERARGLISGRASK